MNTATRAPHGLEFGQEHWDSACENMPQEYVDKIVAMTIPKVKPAPHLDTIQKWAAIETRNEARKYPRPGQPAFDAPLEDWYRERARRIRWENAEAEKHFTNCG